MYRMRSSVRVVCHPSWGTPSPCSSFSLRFLTVNSVLYPLTSSCLPSSIPPSHRYTVISSSFHIPSVSTSSISRFSTATRLANSHPHTTMKPDMKEISVQTGVATVIANKLEQPDLDNRSYRVIQLPNKLEALIVHDPDTDKASAALDVHVGNFSDSEDLPVSCLMSHCFYIPAPAPH